MWKLKSLIWDFCFQYKGLKVPHKTALVTSHRYWYAVFLCFFNPKCLPIFHVIYRIHQKYDSVCCPEVCWTLQKYVVFKYIEIFYDRFLIQFCLVPGSTLCHVNTFKLIETCFTGQNVVYFVKCSTCTWKEYEFGLLCVMFYKCRWGQFGSSVAQIFYALADCLAARSISDWDRSAKNLWLLPDCLLLS